MLSDIIERFPSAALKKYGHWWGMTTGEICKDYGVDTRCFVAFNKNKIVGTMLYELYKYKSKPAIIGSGVWVSRLYQRQGIGFQLWRRTLLKHRNHQRIVATATSKGGWKLLCKVEQEFSKRIFMLQNDS